MAFERGCRSRVIDMYPSNDYRDYLEHSARGQKWSNHKYLYITPDGRYVYPENQTARRVENTFRPLVDKSKNRPRGRQTTYGTIVAPDGSSIVKKVSVAKKQKLGTYRKAEKSGSSGVLEEKKTTHKGRRPTYSVSTGPDGVTQVLRRGNVSKGKKLGRSEKVIPSGVFNGGGVKNYKTSLDYIRVHNIKDEDLKIGGKSKPRTRPNTQRKKKRTSGSGRVEYWT